MRQGQSECVTSGKPLAPPFHRPDGVANVGDVFMTRSHCVTILAADAALVSLSGEALSGLGCRIATVIDAPGVMRDIRALSPHLVLLDSQLEVNDAFDICDQIKRDTVALVLMMLELREYEIAQRAIDAGADDFISTPLDTAELKKRVENMLKLHDAMS